MIEVKPGNVLRIDGWRLSSLVLAGDEFSPLRISTNNSVILSLAARVEVTGRTVQKLTAGAYGVRVKITLVGDGEPDQYLSGYLLQANGTFTWADLQESSAA